jgi:uncharacterized protein YcbX
MGGEALDGVKLDDRGVIGDRWFAVEDEEGRFASGKHTRRFRRRDHVFDYRSSTAADGSIEVRGHGGAWRVGDPALDEELSRTMGTAVRVTPENGVPHQDAGSVSLVGTASLRWCSEHLGVDADPRRLRVNIVVRTDEPFIEESWLGRTVRIGSCSLRVLARIERCRMIDIVQDGVTPERAWLKPLAEHRVMNLALYADVAAPGEIHIGDAVEEPGLPVDR